MVGHYETLINELCTFRTASGEIRPKIIASTATISRAKEQCHALYGCTRDQVFQFPPSGLDAGNSFFAEEDRLQNGRRYVGILATGSSSDATTAIRLYTALLYGAKAMKVGQESDRDPYWTNMGYYNSLRELGQAATWIRLILISILMSCTSVALLISGILPKRNIGITDVTSGEMRNLQAVFPAVR